MTQRLCSHSDLRLDDRVALDGGWIDFPNTIRLEQPGCYNLQFDYHAGTTRMALRYAAPALPTCAGRRAVTALARSVGQHVDVKRFFSAAHFAWVSDQGASPPRTGDDAASYASMRQKSSALGPFNAGVVLELLDDPGAPWNEMMPVMGSR